MAVVPNIINMVRGFNERKENAKIDDVISQNYLNNPQAAIEQVMQIDAQKALQLEENMRQRQSQETAARLADQKARAERVSGAMKYLRALPEGSDYGTAVDSMGGLFSSLGLDDQDVGAIRGIVSTPGLNLAALDDDAWKAMVKDQYSTSVMTPGSHALRGGEVVHKVPFGMKTVTTKGGDGSARTDVFDPNEGRFVVEGGAASIPGAADGAGDLAPPRLIPTRATGEHIEALALQAVPGVNVTSRERTPEHNARVGGQPDSYHLTTRGGKARDFTPPQGMTMDELHQRLRSAYGRGWDVINEGDHVHVEPGSGGGGGGAAPATPTARQTASPTSITMPGKPAQSVQVLSPDEAVSMGFQPGTIVQRSADGSLKVLQKPTATATKDAAKEESSAEARQRVGGMLGNMADVYSQLSSMGAITDPENDTISNIEASIGSSGIGQFFGGVFGTEAQSLRQQIRNNQPLLLQNIREATNMGARGLDSNKEMEFYVQAASDPSRDLTSNLSALVVLDMAYGSGDGSAVLNSLPPDLRDRVAATARNTMASRGTKLGKPKQGGATPPQVGEVRRGWRFKGGNPAVQANWEKVQ